MAFEKTGMLQPGESETLTLSFAVEDLASYDAENYGCYVLEAGDYILSINENSHTEIATTIYTQPETVAYGEDNPRSSDQIAAVNQFDFAVSDSYVTLSREDGFANYAEAVAAPASTR